MIVFKAVGASVSTNSITQESERGAFFALLVLVDFDAKRFRAVDPADSVHVDGIVGAAFAETFSGVGQALGAFRDTELMEPAIEIMPWDYHTLGSVISGS